MIIDSTCISYGSENHRLLLLGMIINHRKERVIMGNYIPYFGCPFSISCYSTCGYIFNRWKEYADRLPISNIGPADCPCLIFNRDYIIDCIHDMFPELINLKYVDQIKNKDKIRLKRKIDCV